MSGKLVWVHDACLSPEDPAVAGNPDAVLLFVFDEPVLRAEPVAFHRLAFVYEGVCELFGAVPHALKEVRRGDPAAELLDAAREHDRDELHVTHNPDPRTQEVLSALGGRLKIVVYPRDELARYHDDPVRFSRYWNKVARQVLGYNPRR